MVKDNPPEWKKAKTSKKKYAASHHFAEKEFNLSEKEILFETNKATGEILPMFYKKDIKEFIKLLKKEFIAKFELSDMKNKKYFEFQMIIDKLAGAELSK